MTPAPIPRAPMTSHRSFAAIRLRLRMCRIAIHSAVKAMISACAAIIAQARLLAVAMRHPDFPYVIGWRAPK